MASDDGVRTYVQALVRLIHGLGALAYAGGVTDEQDLLALWACGFDAATGPAVTAAWVARDAALSPGFAVFSSSGPAPATDFL